MMVRRNPNTGEVNELLTICRWPRIAAVRIVELLRRQIEIRRVINVANVLDSDSALALVFDVVLLRIGRVINDNQVDVVERHEASRVTHGLQNLVVSVFRIARQRSNARSRSRRCRNCKALRNKQTEFDDAKHDDAENEKSERRFDGDGTALALLPTGATS